MQVYSEAGPVIVSGGYSHEGEGESQLFKGTLCPAMEAPLGGGQPSGQAPSGLLGGARPSLLEDLQPCDPRLTDWLNREETISVSPKGGLPCWSPPGPEGGGRLSLSLLKPPCLWGLPD